MIGNQDYFQWWLSLISAGSWQCCSGAAVGDSTIQEYNVPPYAYILLSRGGRSVNTAGILW